MDELPLDDLRVLYAISFPRPTTCSFQRISELKAMGIESVLNCGRSLLWTPFGELRVLGKGHAGVVILSRNRGKFIAIKARRIDSKRKSLRDEALYQTLAANSGVAPKVVGFSDNFVISEAIIGPLLLDLVKEGALTAQHLLASVESLATLDKINILHKEISRPLKNIIFSDSKALILDYESAKRGCGNLSKFASWLLNFLRIDNVKVKDHVFKILKEYRHACPERVDDVEDTLKNIILSRWNSA